ncbi:MAG TPA: hypothetical protein PK158_03960 [Spirochaetota bacterium]|nr:hypothetical protein [Spirochaetota bacterium]
MKAVLTLVFLLFQQEDPGFYVSVEEIASPLHYSLYKIEIFRDSSGQFIKLINYKGRNFKKTIDPELYLNVVSKLTRLGIKQLVTDYSVQSSSGYYIVEFKSGNHQNRVLIENNRFKAVTSVDSLAIIRLIRNTADLTLYDMRSR